MVESNLSIIAVIALGMIVIAAMITPLANRTTGIVTANSNLGAISFGSSATTATNGAYHSSDSLGISVTMGQAILVIAHPLNNSIGASVSTVSDGVNTYTSRVTSSVPGFPTFHMGEIWTAIASTSVSLTISFTYTNRVEGGVTVLTYNGVLGFGNTAQTSLNSGSCGPCTLTVSLASTSGNWIAGDQFYGSCAAYSFVQVMTQRQDSNPSCTSNPGRYIGVDTLSVTGTNTITYTYTGSSIGMASSLEMIELLGSAAPGNAVAASPGTGTVLELYPLMIAFIGLGLPLLYFRKETGGI